MKDNQDTPDSKFILLQAAEKNRQSLESHLLQTSGDLKGVFRELQTYLAELEFQNEELRQAFDERSKSYQILQELFENAPVGYCVLSRIGIVRDANAAICRLLGLERSQVLGRSFGRFVHPEHHTKFFTHLQALWSGATDSTELKITIDDKTTRLVLMESIRLHDRPEMIYAVAVDVSQRHRASDNLGTNEEKFRQLFNEMIGGAAVLDVCVDEVGKPVDAVVLDVNPAFERMTGISRDRAAGKRVLEVLPPTERPCFKALSDTLLMGKPTQFEIYLRQMKRRFEVKAYRLKQGPVVVTGMEITESKTGGQALHQAKDGSGTRTAAGAGQLEDCVIDLARQVEKSGRTEKEWPRTSDEVAARERQIRQSAGEVIGDEKHEHRRPSQLLRNGLQENLISIRMRLGIIQDKVPGADSEYEMAKIDALIDESIQMARLLRETTNPPADAQENLARG